MHSHKCSQKPICQFGTQPTEYQDLVLVVDIMSDDAKATAAPESVFERAVERIKAENFVAYLPRVVTVSSDMTAKQVCACVRVRGDGLSCPRPHWPPQPPAPHRSL